MSSIINQVFKALEVDQYIENFKFSTSSLIKNSGKITLSNLKLRKYAFDNLIKDSPVIVYKGIIGKLSLNIPVLKIQSNPIIVDVEDVYILLLPKKYVKYDREEETRRDFHYKKNQLSKLEEKLNTKEGKISLSTRLLSFGSKLVKKESSFNKMMDLSGTLEKIINNIQINIRHVHVRYEDPKFQLSPTVRSNLMCAASINQMTLHSTNSNWKETFQKEIQEQTYKLIRLNGMTTYVLPNIDRDALLFRKVTDDFHFIKIMKESATSGNMETAVIEPVNTELKLTMQKWSAEMNQERPHFDIHMLISQLHMKLNDTQYRSMLSVMEYLTNYHTYAPYRHMKPNMTILKAPKRYWSYAIRAVIKKCRTKYIFWKDLIAHRENREAYIALYKKSLKVPYLPAINEADKMEMRNFENLLSLPNLIFYRKLARQQITEEMKKYADAKQRHQFKAATTGKGPIIYNEENIAISQDFVKLKWTFELVSGKVELWNIDPIVQVNVNHVHCNFEVLRDSLKTNLTLSRFDVIDPQANVDHYRYIIRRKNLKNEDALMTLFIMKYKKTEMTVDRPDYFIGCSLDQIYILNNIPLIQRLLSFVMFDHINVQELERLARRNLKHITKFAKNEIRKALDNKLFIDLDLSIRAPYFVIPHSFEEDSPFVLVDLGHFSAKSISPTTQQTEEDKPKQMKERLKLNFTEMQIFYQQHGIKTFFDEGIIDQHALKHPVMENTSLAILLSQSIVQEDEKVPRLLFSSQIEKVTFNMSPDTLKTMINLGSDINKLVQNPTGSNKSDVKYSGKLMVSAPFTNNKWTKCTFEIKSTRKMFVYDLETSQLIGTIKLSKDTQVSPSKSQDRTFKIALPQKQEIIHFYFCCNSPQSRNEWVEKLKALLLTYHTNFYVGNIAESLIHDLQAAEIDAGKGLGIMTPINEKQHLIGGLFKLDKICLRLMRHNKLVSELQFNNIHSNFAHKMKDTSLTMFVKQLCVISETGESVLVSNYDALGETQSSKYLHQVTIQDEDEETMDIEKETGEHRHIESNIAADHEDKVVSITISRARSKSSPYYRSDAMISMDTHFHGVSATVEPKILSGMIQYVTDLQSIISMIEKEQQSSTYSGKQEFLTKENIFKIFFQSGPISASVYQSNVEFPFAVMTLPSTEISFFINPKAFLVEALIPQLLVRYNNEPNNSYTVMEFAHEIPMVLKYKQHITNTHDLRYHKFLSINMSQLRYKHHQQFITKLRNYFQSQIQSAMRSELGRKLPENIADLRRWRALSLVKLDITLNQPQLIIPVSLDHPEDIFIADLKEMKISNQLSLNQDHSLTDNTTVISKGMKLVSKQNDKRHAIVKEVDLNLVIVNMIVNSVDQPNPNLKLKLSTSNIQCELTKEQYQMFFDMANNNLLQGIDSLSQEQQFYGVLRELSQKIAKSIPSSALSNIDSAMDIESLKDEVEHDITKLDDLKIDKDIHLDVPSMELHLKNDEGVISTLTFTTMKARTTQYLGKGRIVTTSTILDVVGRDGRTTEETVFDTLFSSKQTGDKKHAVILQHEYVEGEHNCTINLPDPTIIIVPYIMEELKNFFWDVEYFKPNSIQDEIEIAQVSNNINLRAHLGQPEIIFLENEKDHDSRQVVFTVGIDFSFTKKEMVEQGLLSLINISAFITSNTSKIKSVMVHPLSFDMKMTNVKDEAKRIIRANMARGDLIRISYKDITLLTSILKKFNLNLNLEHVENFIRRKQFIGFQFPKLPISFNSEIEFSYQSSNPIKVLVVDDSHGVDIPLIKFKLVEMNSDFKYHLDSDLVHSVTKFFAYLNYYNFSIAAWEPILELTPKPFELIFERKPNPSNADLPPVDNIDFNCASQINFNFTQSMIETLLKTAKSWMSGVQSSSTSVSRKFEEYSIINHSGLPLFLQIQHAQTRTEIPPYKYPFSLIQKSISKEVTIYYQNDFFTFVINKVNHIIWKKYQLHIDISLVEGTKVISIHSGIAVINNTNYNFEIASVQDNEEPDLLSIIASTEKSFLPISAKYASTNFLVFRPVVVSAKDDVIVKDAVNNLVLPNCELSSQDSAKEDDSNSPSTTTITEEQITNSTEDELEEVAMVGYSPKKNILTCKEMLNLDRKCQLLILCKGDKKSFYSVIEIAKHQNLLTLTIKPCISIFNSLPVPITLELYHLQKSSYSTLGRFEIANGSYIEMHHLNMKKPIFMQAHINYNGEPMYIHDNRKICIFHSQELLEKSMTLYDNENRTLNFDLSYSKEKCYHDVTISVPFWILDHSHLPTMKVEHNSTQAAGEFMKVNNYNIQLYNFTHSNIVFQNKINVISNGLKSNPFPIDNPGQEGTLKLTGTPITDGTKNTLYVGVGVHLLPAPYTQTKLVVLSPRYILENRIEDEMMYIKEVTKKIVNEELVLAPNGGKRAFYNQYRKPRITIRMLDSLQSVEIPLIHPLSELDVILYHEKTNSPIYISVQIKCTESITHVIFKKKHVPPYQIQNDTDLHISVAQQGSSDWSIITPKTTSDFAYPYLALQHRMIVNVSNLKSTVVSLDQIGYYSILSFNGDDRLKPVSLKVFTQNHIRILKVYYEKRRQHQRTSSQTDVISISEVPSTIFNLNLLGIGVSFIDDTPKEMLFMQLRGIRTRLISTDKHHYFELHVPNFQIDNQLPKTPYPVLITKSRKTKEDYFRLALIYNKSSAKNTHEFSAMNIQFDDSLVFLDLNSISIISKFFSTFEIAGITDPEPEIDPISRLPTNMFLEVNTNAYSLTKKLIPTEETYIYIKQFQIGPAKSNVSFLFNNTAENNVFGRFARSLGIGFSANVDDSPVQFTPVVFYHPFMPVKSFIDILVQHYQRKMITEIYKSIGSFDFIGNPIGLLNDIDEGVNDLLYRPVDGLTKSPIEFTKGVMNGTASFLKHSFHGTFNSVSKVTESLGNGIAYLSFDDSYITGRQEANFHGENDPKHFGDGIMKGINTLSSGVWQSATGLITQPIRGASEDGITGFLSGVGKGVVGVPIKSLGGVIDAVAKTTKGLKNTTTYFERVDIQRTRFPRAMGPNGRLIPYQQDSSVAQSILWELEKRKYAGDSLIAHVHLKNPQSYLLLTAEYSALIHIKAPQQYSLEWILMHQHISYIKMTKFGLYVGLNKYGQLKQVTGWFGSVVSERRILSNEKPELIALKQLYKHWLTILQQNTVTFEDS